MDAALWQRQLEGVRDSQLRIKIKGSEMPASLLPKGKLEDSVQGVKVCE